MRGRWCPRLIVIPGRCESIEPGISRFRIWSFGPSLNDRPTVITTVLPPFPDHESLLRRSPASAPLFDGANDRTTRDAVPGGEGGGAGQCTGGDCEAELRGLTVGRIIGVWTPQIDPSRANIEIVVELLSSSKPQHPPLTNDSEASYGFGLSETG